MNYSFCDNKNILITGGTGTFGKTIIKFLLNNTKLRRLVCYSRDELKQYELNESISDKRLRFFIGDVRDHQRLLQATMGIDYIIHAAAMKQVPASEYNPTECIKTNIHGAENIIKASINSKVKKVIALSTDKAANPINLYGATKLVSDKLFIAANNITGKNDIIFSTVRYGNVINSRGSVIPFFLKLIKENNKFLPITHEEMTRFVITLNSGVEFVLKSLKLMKGGEIFIPKIQALKIIDLAKAIAPNLKRKIVGIRPGEKLHETLCPNDESKNIIEFKNYYLISPSIQFVKKRNYFISLDKEKGKKVKSNFEYTSNINVRHLKENEIKKLIKNISNNTG